MGKALPALLMHGPARTVPQAGEMARLLEAWPGDLAADAVTFRLSAGLHALARSGRAPGLVAVLMTLAERGPMPCEVLELGSSTGLNLNFPRYACRVGARVAMTPGSPVALNQSTDPANGIGFARAANGRTVQASLALSF